MHLRTQNLKLSTFVCNVNVCQKIRYSFFEVTFVGNCNKFRHSFCADSNLFNQVVVFLMHENCFFLRVF